MGALPNGRASKSDKEYIDGWREFCIPFERFTGMKHTSFDPDIQFKIGEQRLDLPVWFIEIFNEKIKEK
jgi:hypothetical protein